jgi:hypothetical protein
LAIFFLLRFLAPFAWKTFQQDFFSPKRVLSKNITVALMPSPALLRSPSSYYLTTLGIMKKKKIRNTAPKLNLETSLNLGVGEKLVCALYFLDWSIRSKVMDDSNVRFARF